MGREVRMVPADWQHPKEFHEYSGELRYRPQYEHGYAEAASEWDAGWAKWQIGVVAEDGDRPKAAEEMDKTYTWYAGPRPSPDDYMPDWPDEQRTHYMMYEDTSEGTPISPAFATPEELARWLADTGASAFAGMPASYEAWLRVAKGGYAPSLVISGGTMSSGVEAFSEDPSHD